jgi:hypothetical protein
MYWNWDRAVGTVTRLCAGQPKNCGLTPGRGKRFSHGAHPANGPTQWVKGAVILGVKRYEGNPSPPPSAMVKNECSYISTPPYALMACTGTNVPLHSEELTRFYWPLPLFANFRVHQGQKMMPQNESSEIQ